MREGRVVNKRLEEVFEYARLEPIVGEVQLNESRVEFDSICQQQQVVE